MALFGKPKDRRNPVGWIDQHGLAGRQSVKVSHLVFWFAFASALISATLPPFRYFYLVTPFLVVLALLADGRGVFPEEVRAYALFIFGGVLFAPLGNKEGMRDLFLTFSGISVGFLASVPRIPLQRVVALIFFSTLAFFAMFGHIKDIVKFNFIGSESALESSSAFYMGAFAVFAIYRRRWWLYLFCLLCTVLFLKRIALLAALAAGAVYLLGERRSRWLLNPITMIIANLAIVVLTMAYALGYFDYFLLHYTDQSANALGQGRQTFLRPPSMVIESEWWRFLFVGKGAGSVYTVMHRTTLLSGVAKVNLHSDLMKIVYEYGFFWYMLIIGAMYSVRGFRAKMLSVFINVLFITDNSLIYYLLIFYIVICCRMDPDVPESAEHPPVLKPAPRGGAWVG